MEYPIQDGPNYKKSLRSISVTCCEHVCAVEPMTVSLYDNAKPFKAPAHRYILEKRRFLERNSANLQNFGFIWISAPLIEPKSPPAYYRLTIDLRPVNAATIPIVLPMPNIESELINCLNFVYFASFYFVYIYWQLSMAESSQHF